MKNQMLINSVAVKLEDAQEAAHGVHQRCLAYCNAPTERNLLRISSSLGAFTSPLRSVLNYIVHHFVDDNIKPTMSSRTFREKNLHRDADFPYAMSLPELDNKPFIQLLKSDYHQVYQLIENSQPYHLGNEWLYQLTRINNADKHKIINKSTAADIVDIAATDSNFTPHQEPVIFGDKLVTIKGSNFQYHQLPSYYDPYGSFAVKEGQWYSFYIEVDQQMVGLMQFVKRTPTRVEALANEFISLL